MVLLALIQRVVSSLYNVLFPTYRNVLPMLNITTMAKLEFILDDNSQCNVSMYVVL